MRFSMECAKIVVFKTKLMMLPFSAAHDERLVQQ